MTPLLSCVIVTHNSQRELESLLSSLEKHLGDRAEVIIVDSGSRDQSLSVATNHGAKIFSLPHNPGFGTASNLGVEHASGDVVALLNPDIELLDRGLLQLAGLAREREAIFVPRLLNSDGSVQRSAHPYPGKLDSLLPALIPPTVMPRRLAKRFDLWRSEQPLQVGWAIAACMVARTDLLRKLGPFDPEIFLYYEDMDLCLRAAEHGAPTVLRPEIRLKHSGAHSTQEAFRGEPYELLAKRRHDTIATRLGTRAARTDDLSQRVTFTSRSLLKRALRRDNTREQAQLKALKAAK